MAIQMGQYSEGFQLANRVLDHNSVVTDAAIMGFLFVSQLAAFGFFVGQYGHSIYRRYGPPLMPCKICSLFAWLRNVSV